MLKLALLASLVAAALALVTVSTAFGSTSNCSDFGQFGGGCPNVNGGIQGDGAVLDGDLTVGGSPGTPGTPGTPATPGTPGTPGAPGSGGSGGSGATAEPPRPCEEVYAGWCYGHASPRAGEGAPAAPGIPTVTLSDIAVFRPHAAVQFMQPDGWMVVGLPTNFVAVIERHVVGGTLLGMPAEVRFTPVAYRWRYGDDSTARLTTRGASWQALGLREFDATPTSHVYRASGTYVIELDVEYTAEYRFAGGGWIPLAGVIVLPANDLVATAGEAVTVLVDRDCSSAPRGPGC